MSRAPRSRQAGFTLIEMLVALLVLSLGLLGVAAMQLKSLQSAHAGYQRAVATLAAQDAVELLWSQLDLAAGDCPDASAIETEWAARWATVLPTLDTAPFVGVPPSPLASGDDCVYSLEVSWSEARFVGEAAPVFDYTTRLPRGP